MPKYDFKCSDCLTTFEKKMPMTAVHTAVCPMCGSDHTKRLLSKIAFKSGNGATSSASTSADCAPSG
ncbi:MAG: zinc ribbon domain-containing protein [Anaerolineae bacterium]|nr:zinc ribbon domain-containing protein [Anaerolineae bacterium]